MSTPSRWFVGVLAVIGLLAVVAALAFARAGISARNPPSRLEAWAARRARHLLIPAAARGRSNPLAASTAELERAKDHFVEHCAGCHGYGGRGDTDFGRALSPRASDLTLAATQDLADGELAWIVDNGIRLTGMPSFASESAEDPDHAWRMVLWIRQLPRLTPEEVEAIEHEAEATPAAHEHDSHGEHEEP